MTNEQKARLNELYRQWDLTSAEYDEFCALRYIEQCEYVDRVWDDFVEYYNKNISGKTIYEIDRECWDMWSDWHKDVFGYRPRNTLLGAKPYGRA